MENIDQEKLDAAALEAHSTIQAQRAQGRFAVLMVFVGPEDNFAKAYVVTPLGTDVHEVVRMLLESAQATAK